MSKRSKIMLGTIAGLLVIMFGLGIWSTRIGRNKIEAQNCLKATISGSVLDLDAKPLKNILITSTSAGCSDASGVTDSAGNFEINAFFNTKDFITRITASKEVSQRCSLSGFKDVNVEQNIQGIEIIANPTSECPSWPFAY
jgi:hypothetical protein